jgi:NADH-quinone oxidoreductase subunit G
LKAALADAAKTDAKGVVAVLSPFLTVEEAFLFATYFKGLSKDVRLALGPVPVVGEDDRYPKDVRGNPVEPTKFVIRAEKCPNRRGVEAVLMHFQGAVIRFEDVAKASASLGEGAAVAPTELGSLRIGPPKVTTVSHFVAMEPVNAMWFAGGYPDPKQLEAALPAGWKAPALLVVQDIFPSTVTAAAKFILPATSNFEKDGTFVNHAGLAQTFARAVRPPVEVRTELQLAFDLLGRRGLVQAAAVRAELAKAMPLFADLAAQRLPDTGVRFELPTV